MVSVHRSPMMMEILNRRAQFDRPNNGSIFPMIPEEEVSMTF